MDSQAHQLHVFFLPLFAPGHMIPMIDMARLFAQRGAKATIITTPSNASFVQKTIDRAADFGRHIKIQLLRFPSKESGLPEGCENLSLITSRDMVFNFLKAISMLQQPMEQLIRHHLPNCIVSDMFFPWTADLASELQIPRLVFHGTSFFSLCFNDSLTRYTPHEKVVSDTEPFVVPGLPHPILVTKSQLPESFRVPNDVTNFMDRIKESELNSYGVVGNSFYEMEPAYADHYKETLGRKAWHIGPVSLFNRDAVDKAGRWNLVSIEKYECLSWLDSMKPRSVVYVCFGSLASFKTSQLLEIALGLESSNHPFIWVVRDSDISKEEEWLPRGFEERNKEKGFVIRGWAPQILILEHPSIGGFVTHCGWNSVIEAAAAGVPMVTWPLFAEQFNNEKLVVDVAKIGIEIGAMVWSEWAEERVLVNREQIKKAVERLMDSGEEAEVMRKRAKELGDMAKLAVEEGGSSYVDLELLMDDLIAHHGKSHDDS